MDRDLGRPDEGAAAAQDHHVAGLGEVSDGAAHGQPGDTVGGREFQFVGEPGPRCEPAALDFLPDICCDLGPEVLKPGAVNPAGTIVKRHAVIFTLPLTCGNERLAL